MKQMEPSAKPRVNEAPNVIDSSPNKKKILEKLEAMTEDIIFVKNQIESGRDRK